nr:immunoglobulin light chain junction region [Macaca mulatta]
DYYCETWANSLNRPLL